MDSSSNLVWSIIIAIIFGIIFSYFANYDKIHKKLRNWKITKETSYPSEWFGTFSKPENVEIFIVLQLNDDRRLYGWPIDWPSEPEKGHFVLKEAAWLDYDNKNRTQKEIPLKDVSSIMIDVKHVKWVEIMKKEEAQDGKESVKSTTAG